MANSAKRRQGRIHGRACTMVLCAAQGPRHLARHATRGSSDGRARLDGAASLRRERRRRGRLEHVEGRPARGVAADRGRAAVPSTSTLCGTLKKRHAAEKSLTMQWGKRYFFVDDKTGPPAVLEEREANHDEAVDDDPARRHRGGREVRRRRRRHPAELLHDRSSADEARAARRRQGGLDDVDGAAAAAHRGVEARVGGRTRLGAFLSTAAGAHSTARGAMCACVCVRAGAWSPRGIG